MAVLSYLLLGGYKVFLDSSCSNNLEVLLTACEMSGGSMVSSVTAVSNLPDLPTLHFSSSVRRTKATPIPGVIHKLTALRAIQKHSWSVAFKDISCACGS